MAGTISRSWKVIRVIAGLFLGLIIAAATTLYFIDFNDYRGVLARQLSQNLGRPLTIDGDLMLHLGLHTGFSVTGLSLAADDKGGPGGPDNTGSMARIGRISFGVKLLPLLAREIEIDQMQIQDAEILVTRLPDGRLNWAEVFGQARLGVQNVGGDQWAPPRIADFRLVNTNITYRDSGVDIVLAVEKLLIDATAPTAPAEIVLDAVVQGHGGHAVAFTGQMDNLDAFMAGWEIQVDGTFEFAGATARAKGRIFHPLEGRGMDVHLDVQTKQLQTLLQAAGQQPRLQGPATLSFDLTDRDGPLAIRNLDALVKPEPGLQVRLTGVMANVLALAGLNFEMKVQADDTAQLSQIAGTELPSLAPVLLAGRITGSLRQPVLTNLNIQAGDVDRLLLTATGDMADPLVGTGLDLDIRLQGPDSRILSSFAGTPVPALGRFDVRGHLSNTLSAPQLSGIAGRFHHDDGTEIDVHGAVNDPTIQPDLHLEVKASGPSLLTLAARSGQKVGDIHDPGRFQARAVLTGGIDNPVMSDMHVTFDTASGATLTLSGDIAQLFDGAGIDMQIVIAGTADAVLADLFGLRDVDLVERLSISGRIKGRRDLFNLDLSDISFGDSDLSGRMDVDLRGVRPRIVADLRAEQFDLTSLTKASMATNQDGVAAAEEGAEGRAEKGANERLIPNLALNPGALKMLDGGIKLQAKRLLWDDVVVDNIHLEATLENGNLVVKPSTGRLAGGQLIVNGHLKNNDLNFQVSLRRAAFAELGAMIDFSDVDGSLDLSADLAGPMAPNLRAVAAGLNGNVSAVITDGHVNSGTLDLLAKDLVVALVAQAQSRAQSKQGVRLHCFANAYDIRAGLAKSQVLLLDTDSMTITGDGQINLADEVVRYHLVPKPKDPSLFSLATPINVTGTITDPSFAPDSVSVAGSVAVAVVGNLLLPGVGLLLPLLNAGTGGAQPCMNVIKNGKAVAAPGKDGTVGTSPGMLDQVGDTVKSGAKSLMQLPGKVLETK